MAVSVVFCVYVLRISAVPKSGADFVKFDDLSESEPCLPWHVINQDIYCVFNRNLKGPTGRNTGEEITGIICSNVKLQGSNYSSN